MFRNVQMVIKSVSLVYTFVCTEFLSENAAFPEGKV
jgi:hypothetical protein